MRIIDATIRAVVLLLGVLVFLFGVFVGIDVINQKLQHGLGHVNSKLPLGSLYPIPFLLAGAYLVRLGRRKPDSREAGAMPSQVTRTESPPTVDRGGVGRDGASQTGTASS